MTAKLKTQADRGNRAKRLLENELFSEALEKIENDIVEAWKRSGGRDEDQRRNAYLMLRLFQNFKQHFITIINTGQHAEKELLKLREKSKLRRMINV